MGHYKSNLRDIEFNLFEVLRRQDVLGAEPYPDLDEETARGILDEVNRLATGPLAESFAEADRNPPVFDPATGSVHMPEGFKKSYQAFVDAEWFRLELPPELGGNRAPRSLGWAVAELILGANPAVWMYSSGPVFAHLLWRLGTPEQKRFAEQAIERRWTATMVLTEPDAGSDVGAGRTKAIRQPDGTWHIEGVKRFITCAEHDMAENIFHLVLARPEGHGPGTKGLSMFLVPKYLVDADGNLGERNGVEVTNLEHKMGLKASTTCELTLGTGRPAVGTLVGDVHDGIRQMFMIIEHARMMVGTKAIAALSTGYLNALDLRQDAGAGRRPGPDGGQGRAPGHDHPPPRRPPDAHDAEGIRRGDAGAAAVYGLVPGCAAGRGGRRQGRHRRRRPQRPAAPGGEGGRLRARLRAAQPVPADAGGFRLPAGLPHRAVHQGRQDRQRVRGHHRDPGARPVLPEDPARRGPGPAVAAGTDHGVRRQRGGNGRLKPERTALAQAAGEVEAMVSAMAGWAVASLERPAEIYRAGLNTTRLLMALGDLVIGWLLARQAEVALAALDGQDARLSDRDRAFYQGKLATSRFFAQTVLPRLTVDRRAVEETTLELMELPEEAF